MVRKKIINNKRELLLSITKKDFTVQTFKSGGKGGQHQNTTDSGVRIIHKDSGAVGECRETRKQGQNKKIAFKRLAKTYKFKRWLNLKIWEILNEKTIEKEVENMMDIKNLKIEVRSDGVWANSE